MASNASLTIQVPTQRPADQDVADYQAWCDQLFALHLEDPSQALIDRLKLRVLERHTRLVGAERSTGRVHGLHTVLLDAMRRLHCAERALRMI
jgi:hypothetical protein